MYRKILRKYHHWKMQRALFGPRLLFVLEQCRPNAFFVQIGANDGDQLDPLRKTVFKSNWAGIMVEPVPYIFERLMKNNVELLPRVKFINAAVAEEDSTKPFYYLKRAADYREEGLPFWYDQLGSFRKEIVLKHEADIPDIHDRLVQADLQCLSFSSLMDMSNVTNLDLLHTDVEGYDYRLLLSIDLQHYRPVLIIYEHYHLAEKERQVCQEYLKEHGYEWVEEGMDTWCLRKSELSATDGSLLKLWNKVHGLN